MSRKRALIAGYGYVGSALGRALSEEGYAITAIRRTPHEAPKDVEQCCLDLLNRQSLEAIRGDFDLCFYLVAATSHDETAYRQAYVEGLKNLLEHLQSLPTRNTRCIFASSTAVYHQEDGSWVDEDSPTLPKSFAGKILLEAEALLRKLSSNYSIVRFSGIYGPGRMRIIEQLRGHQTITANQDVYSNRIHRDDCVGILKFLAELPSVPQVVIGSDSEPTELRTIYSWLASRLVLPPPVRSEVPVTSSPSLRGNKRCSNALLVKLGYQLQFPSYREGIEKELAS